MLRLLQVLKSVISYQNEAIEEQSDTIRLLKKKVEHQNGKIEKHTKTIQDLRKQILDVGS